MRLVADVLEPAFDSRTRKRGLLGRDGLAPGHAMVIAPSNMVHTFFMRFPIDVLIVSRGGRVVKATAGVGPRRLVGSWRGFAVIELAAGALLSSQTAVGDTLTLVSSSKVSS